jgi:hypothetical protein
LPRPAAGASKRFTRTTPSTTALVRWAPLSAAVGASNPPCCAAST